MSFLEDIKQKGENFAVQTNTHTKSAVDKGEFDKTYIGRVIDANGSKDDFGKVKGELIDKWTIQANGTLYYVDARNTNIRSVGQQVRVYLPNNKRNTIYAEVINPVSSPDAVIYMTDVMNKDSEWYRSENEQQFKPYLTYAFNTVKPDETGRDVAPKEEDVHLDVIVERWLLPNTQFMERYYFVTLVGDECTNLICPDGKVINLIGW